MKASNKLNEYSLEQNQKCNICYNFYQTDNPPHVLSCGHTFCLQCVEKIYTKEEKTIKCALDKKIFHYESISEIPLNFSYFQLLKAISKTGINTNCFFSEESTQAHKICTVDELSNCKTILDLKILHNHPHINQAKEYIYEKLIRDLNNSTIFTKFTENKKFQSTKKNIYESGEYFEGVYMYGKKNGWGRKRNKFGILYEGFYSDGHKEGYGIEISKTLDIYVGQFVNNMKTGSGVVFYNKPDSKYSGEFYMNKKHGQGVEIFNDKSCYDGCYLHGMRTGTGTMTYPNGNYLKGQFVNGRLEGEGKEKNQNFRYKGNFRAGIKHGQGIIVYEGGNMYKGNFCEGRLHGNGEFRYSNGSVYVGDYFENKKQGEGRLELAQDGVIVLTYIGEFVNDLYDGKGVLVKRDFWTYKGEFRHGVRSGYGILTYINKDEYRGYFENDMKNGQGEMYYSDKDECITGIWQDDYLLRNSSNSNNKYRNIDDNHEYYYTNNYPVNYY